MKKCLLILFFLLARIAFTQIHSDYLFYMPEDDSLPWGGPLSPRLISKEKIRELTISERKWYCTARTPNKIGDQKSFSCNYIQTSCTYTYDSFGFPTRVLLKQDSIPTCILEYIYVNTYNENGQIKNVTQLGWNKECSRFLAGNFYTIAYNEQGRVRLFQTFRYDSILAEIQEFNYINNTKGYQKQCIKKVIVADSFLTTKKVYQYDSDNRLLEANGTYYLYDQQGQDSGFYNLPRKDFWRKGEQINISPTMTATLVTTHSSSRATGRSKTRRRIEAIRENKDNKIFTYECYYRRQFVTVSCLVIDTNTGLPLFYKQSPEWPMVMKKHSYKIIDFHRVKVPERKCQFEFPEKSNIREYSYISD